MHALTVLLFAAQAGAATPVDALHWLAGHWRTADGTTEEVWLAPRDGSMLGMNRGPGRPGFEFLRIVADDGPAYLASPGGRTPPVRFRMTLLEPLASVRFENPEHDFPKVVSYRRTAAGLRACVGDGAREACWDFVEVRP